MSNPDYYFQEVVREKLMSPPIIFDGEHVVQEFKRGVGPAAWIVLIISLFILPLLPFVVALILYEKLFHLKHSKLFLTDRRLVFSNRSPRYHNVHSIPLHHIKTIRRASTQSPFQGMIDRMFGFSDIQLWTDENILRQLVIKDVKKSKELVEIVEQHQGRKVGQI